MANMGNKIKYSWNILILLLFNIYREQKSGAKIRVREKVWIKLEEIDDKY